MTLCDYIHLNQGREATSRRSPSEYKVFVSLSRTALAHQPLSQLPPGCYLGGQFKLLSLVQLSFPASCSPPAHVSPSSVLPPSFICLLPCSWSPPQLPSCLSPSLQPSSPNCPQVLALSGEAALAILGSASFPASWLAGCCTADFRSVLASSQLDLSFFLLLLPWYLGVGLPLVFFVRQGVGFFGMTGERCQSKG